MPGEAPFTTDNPAPQGRAGGAAPLPDFFIWVLHRAETPRWRLLLRVIYFVVMSVVVRVWGLFAGAVALLQWGNILVTGKRSRRLSEWYLQWYSFASSLTLYVGGVTEEAPSLFSCPFKYELEVEKPPQPPE